MLIILDDKNALCYKENNLIDSHGNMYLTVHSLIEMNKKVTGSKNTTLGKVDIKHYGFEKRSRYMDIWTKLYGQRSKKISFIK